MQRRFLILASLAALVAVCVVACSGEGEGQRCSTNDDPGGSPNNAHPYGTSDCADGLLCYPASALGSPATDYARAANDTSLGICCPVTRYSLDSVLICATSPSPPGGDAAPPADAATPANDAAAETDSGDSSAPASDAETDAADAGAIADAAATG